MNEDTQCHFRVAPPFLVKLPLRPFVIFRARGLRMHASGNDSNFSVSQILSKSTAALYVVIVICGGWLFRIHFELNWTRRTGTQINNMDKS